MKYLFNCVGELRKFVKNDFESSHKIILVEKDNKIIVLLNAKQIATIPYKVCICNNQPMYIIDPNEIEILKYIFDKSITFEEIVNNENTKNIDVANNSVNVKYINFKYKDKYYIEIKPSGVYEITVNSEISTKANHFTNIFDAIDKAIEK